MCYTPRRVCPAEAADKLVVSSRSSRGCLGSIITDIPGTDGERAAQMRNLMHCDGYVPCPEPWKSIPKITTGRQPLTHDPSIPAACCGVDTWCRWYKWCHPPLFLRSNRIACNHACALGGCHDPIDCRARSIRSHTGENASSQGCKGLNLPHVEPCLPAFPCFLSLRPLGILCE